jgi:uncharacterized protein YbjT (DUF2867 family)
MKKIMIILVIGANASIRSQTVERLREKGHEAMPASPPRRHVGSHTEAPRDPGHAGRHLRHFLERAFALTRDPWCGLRRLEAGNRRARS